MRRLSVVWLLMLCALPARGGEPPDDGGPLRRAAVEKLAKSAEKLRGPADAETARHVARLVRLTAGSDAAARGSVEAKLRKAAADTAVPTDDVVQRLRAQVARLGKTKSDLAFLGARTLRALGVQRRRAAGSSSLDPLETEALAVLEPLRQARWKRTKPATANDLRAIPPEERRAWSLAHGTWDAPALAVSPQGLYRVESVAGWRPTLLAAVDAEAAHRRLARWFGSDLRAGAPFTIRLIGPDPEKEGEGQGLLWARGFTMGDAVILPAATTARRWFSRGLAHELTHRFDGELHGVMPKWLLEGRANHAQVATTWSGAEDLDERAVDFSMLERAHASGAGELARLTALLDSRPEPAVSDYDAGYALWTYLTRHRRFWFGPRLGAYLAAHRTAGAKNPRALFETHLVDGKSGRPSSLDALARDFAQFLAEAAGPVTGWKQVWSAENAEAAEEARLAAAAASRPDGDEDEEMVDPVSRPARRVLVAPAFGERHAFSAGTFLAAAGDAEGATLAFAWSREVDEPERDDLARMAAFREKAGDRAAAWLLRAAAARLGGPPPGPPPQAIETLEEPWMAFLKLAVAEPPEMLAPGARPAAWAAAGATATPEAQWCVRDGRDLVLGRASPGKRPEGALPSDAAAQLVFLETAQLDDAYTLRARVRPLSRETRAAVVLGRTRDDRGFTIRLGPGGLHGANGIVDGLTSVAVEIDDLRDTDWGIASLSAVAPLDPPAAAYDLLVQVTGAYVRIDVAGRPALSFRTATGLPLAGGAGFLLTSGAVEFQDVSVQRSLDASVATLALDSAPPPAAWDGLRLGGVPPDPAGVLLLADDTLLASIGTESPGKVRVHAPLAAASRPPHWIVLDGDGFVRSHGLCTPGDPGLARARKLLRRLRGY